MGWTTARADPPLGVGLFTFVVRKLGFTVVKPHFAKTRVFIGPELVIKFTSDFADACFSKSNMNMLMYM